MSFWFRRLLAAFRPPAGAYARAVAMLERGQAEAALPAFDEALAAAQTGGERLRIHNKRAVALVALGRREEAILGFVEALSIDPRFAPAITNVGNLLLEDGALDEAILHYEAAIRADENYPVAHLNLGIAYRRSGRRSAAVRHLRTAHRLEARLRFRGVLGGDLNRIE